MFFFFLQGVSIYFYSKIFRYRYAPCLPSDPVPREKYVWEVLVIFTTKLVNTFVNRGNRSYH